MARWLVSRATWGFLSASENFPVSAPSTATPSPTTLPFTHLATVKEVRTRNLSRYDRNIAPPSEYHQSALIRLICNTDSREKDGCRKEARPYCEEAYVPTDRNLSFPDHDLPTTIAKAMGCGCMAGPQSPAVNRVPSLRVQQAWVVGLKY